MKKCAWAIVGLVALIGGANGEIRTWTSASGQHKFEAEFAGMKDGVVTLRNAAGKNTDVPLDKLSTADRKFAEKLAAAGEAKPTQAESRAVIEKLGGSFTEIHGQEVLSLCGSKVTDAGLVHLKGMTGLKWLILCGAKATDAGLVHIRGLTGLRELNLTDTQVTDAGLVHLKGLTVLCELKLGGTKVTNAGVAKLMAALPDCNIRHNWIFVDDDPKVLEMIIKQAGGWKSIEQRDGRGPSYQKGLFIKKEHETAYTGWVKKIYDNGKVQRLAQIKNGMGNGWHMVWYPNGQMSEKFSAGMELDRYTSWYENGNKKEERTLKGFSLEGLSTSWHENGKKESEMTFKNGKVDGPSTTWDKEGNVTRETRFKSARLVLLLIDGL
jgi:hypothetical protein